MMSHLLVWPDSTNDSVSNFITEKNLIHNFLIYLIVIWTLNAAEIAGRVWKNLCI